MTATASTKASNAGCETENANRKDLRTHNGQPSAAGGRNDAALPQEGQRQQVQWQQQRNGIGQNVAAIGGNMRNNPSQRRLRQSERQHGKEEPAATKHCAQDHAGEKYGQREKTYRG